MLLLFHSITVAEVVPLKQGLKHRGKTMIRNYRIVAEVVPLKQGLKPLNSVRVGGYEEEVAEVVPLKQGLKP
mgnify:CR=1 FL=1